MRSTRTAPSTLAYASGSRLPAPRPLAAIRPAGRDPHWSAMVASSATPVGVAVSPGCSTGTVGSPISSSSVAGAGTGT